MEMQRPSQAEQHSDTSLAVIDAPVVLELSLQDLADDVNRVLGQSVENIFAIGRIFLAAKKDKRHGGWERMFKGHPKAIDRPVRFSVKTALMYMKIARHPILSNRNYNYCLPPTWTVLYQLALISPESLLTEFISKGIITPELSMQDAVKLRTVKSSDRLVVRDDGRLGLVRESSDGGTATRAMLEAVLGPACKDFPVKDGDRFRLCGKHWLVIEHIVDPPQRWKELLDGNDVVFVPWPDILACEVFGPHCSQSVVLVQPDADIGAMILGMYCGRYGVEAVEPNPVMPVKMMHRCGECGHDHPDRRTTR